MNRFFLPVFALLCPLLAAQAAVQIYYTDFPESEGSMPVDWVSRSGSGFEVDSGGDFRFDGNGNGVAEYRPDPANGFDSLADYTIEATFRKSPNIGFTGVIGRSQTTGDNFYMARLNGDNTMQLYRFVNGTATQLGSNQTTSETYQSGQVWTIRMTFSGTEISAQILDDSDTVVGSIVETDGSFSSGYSGVRGSDPSVWESYAISVPEVSSFSLILGGAGLLLTLTQRRRS